MPNLDHLDFSKLPDDDKFIELMLYIAQRSTDDPHFGSTKLNKLLFYSEFGAFCTLGHAITWQRFQKLKWGPAARRLKPLQHKIEELGWGTFETRRVYSHPQTRLVPLREPDLSSFEEKEIKVVDSVLKELRPLGAVSISELSHRFIGWRAAQEGEDIPYATALISNRALTPAEKEYATSLKPERAG